MPDPNATRSPAPDGAATPAEADPAATVSGSGADGPAVAPAATARRYELGAEIARGGMGAVYRATDTAFAREVAVKVLLDQYAPTSGTARRFYDEARITGQLQHPNIPAVFDLGTLSDGRPFLAMKLIKGDTLDELLKARPVPSNDRGRFVAAFEQVCQAVAYAHAHNVIHRDLKPSNVMVGSFGEVQVMDWGLAKVLGSSAAEVTDPDGTAPGTAIQSIRESDSAFTQAGSVLGTPAYMPPEQAIGAIHKVDARSDVFGLGAILAVILTGKPPFAGNSVETTRLQAAQGNVEECFARLDASGAEPELVALCKRCLSKKPGDRPADAGEVARAVAALRAAADERARQAELDRVKAEGDKVAAELQAVEQRKRRRVQLVLAGVVVAVLAGAGIATALVLEKQAADKLAAEKKQSEERFAAEQTRQADLRAADQEAAQKQREAKAAALVRALATAEPGAVPVILDELADYRDLARPKLQELAWTRSTSPAALRARLALLADDQALNRDGTPFRYRDLIPDFYKCRLEELPIFLDRLPTAERVSLAGYCRQTLLGLDARAKLYEQMRMPGVLARLEPTAQYWPSLAQLTTNNLVRRNPLEAEPYVEMLRPAKVWLVAPLMAKYSESRAKLKSGKLALSDLAAEATAFDFTANLLGRYAADQPPELAELALTVDGRHYPLFADSIWKNKAAVVPLLRTELAKKPPEKLAVDQTDAALEAHGKRRGYAAAALVALGEGERVWPLFAFPKDGDPTARSYLLERLVAVGADVGALIARYEAEADVSAKRALLVALGDFPLSVVPVGEREALAAKLLVQYREHADPGLHGAIDWLLRQKWGKATELAAIDAELAKAARAAVLAREFAGSAVPLAGPLLPAPAVARGKDWFVNGEGQTFAVVRGPVEFTMGSPLSEPQRYNDEPAHSKRISRTFAMATKEVTAEQYLRFRPKHEWTKQFSPGPDTPAVCVSWYDAAAYCNWLNERAGIPKNQWCYQPNEKGEYGEGMKVRPGHLTLTGYRLPTEVEWEFACRGGTITARYHGRGNELFPRYGWCQTTSGDRAWPVGQLRPNELGVFDALGNAIERCETLAGEYSTRQLEESQGENATIVTERLSHVLRGGSFFYRPVVVRSGLRGDTRPGHADNSNGFRPVRTLPN